MRITNKVIQSNTLTNINRNKVLQDTLNTQLATGKKFSRPSEDPVAAIRALRLRTDVSQIKQYNDRNIPDAQHWLALTESSIETTVAVMKDIVEQCEKGSSDYLGVTDRDKIIDTLKALRDEVYKTGDSDYAGRYIFTGYRTDMSLSFGEQQNDKEYDITQIFDINDLEKMTYIETGVLTDITEANYTDTGKAIGETDIKELEYYRFRLAYDDLEGVADQVCSLQRKKLDASGNVELDALGNPVMVDYATVTVESDAATAYAAAQTNPNAVILVPSTGELVLGKNIYDDLNNSKEQLNLNYQKSKWRAADLRPEHYFYCVTNNEHGQPVKYNPNYLTNEPVSPDQKIEYQIGFDQKVQVNTYASDVYRHDIGRDVDEIVDVADQLAAAEAMVAKFEAMQKDTVNYPDAATEGSTVSEDLKAAQKAVTYLRDQLQKRFSSYITKSQGYLNDTNEALTIVGNRSKRVALAENRLAEQKVTFQELQSKNEDADATEVAVHLSSAEVSYQAALMAAGKIIDTTLLNYL